MLGPPAGGWEQLRIWMVPCYRFGKRFLGLFRASQEFIHLTYILYWPSPGPVFLVITYMFIYSSQNLYSMIFERKLTMNSATLNLIGCSSPPYENN